ncbi:MAG: gluconokinase [Flammeovirgaceae bacterium]
MPYLVAIDIGTTSIKALVVASAGGILTSDQRFYPTHYGPGGIAEQNAQQIFDALIDLIQSVQAKLPNEQLTAIVLSAAMHSIMAVDQRGNAITPLLIWADTRSIKQARSLSGSAVSLVQQTGTPVHPMSPLCKIMWWREHSPSVFENAFKFISIKEYVVYKLTSDFLIDHSIASATGYFDLGTRDWNTTALELMQLNINRLSKPSSVHHLAQISGEALKILGLSNPVQLVLGASDGCSAQLGSGAMERGDVAITLGTSGAVRMASRDRIVNPNGQLFNFILDDDYFVFGGATNNGTAVINWFQKNNPDAPKDLTAFVAETREVPPGSDGLLMLPYLLGERAPIYDAQSSGVFLGISVRHGRLHFQRALLEGICFSLRDILEMVKKNTEVFNRVLVSGGITRSHDWIQMVSDILQQDVYWLDQPDASAVGAAKIGFRALGWHWQLPQPKLHRLVPNTELARVYGRHFGVYQSVYPKLHTAFHQLNIEHFPD